MNISIIFIISFFTLCTAVVLFVGWMDTRAEKNSGGGPTGELPSIHRTLKKGKGGGHGNV
jgi:hypothetical protein